MAIAIGAAATPSPALGADAVAEVRLIATRIQSMLTAARRARDVIRVTCLDDKLTRAHAAVREVARARTRRVRSAIRQRARELVVEAERCSGTEPIRGTVREVVVDPTVPRTDPTELPEGTLWMDRPPSASGYY